MSRRSRRGRARGTGEQGSQRVCERYYGRGCAGQKQRKRKEKERALDKVNRGRCTLLA